MRSCGSREISGEKMKELADRAAKILKAWGDPDRMRDEIDMISGGELDTTQLDILCEMVERRLRGKR